VEIKVVLIDVTGTTVEEVMSPIDPRLPGQPNWLVAQVPVPPSARVKYFFDGEIRADGALIFRERS
jgi:hypothetical protein